MMINELTIDGLRGKKFALKLGPLTLITGENTAGKTTIADAIRWALLGYIPGMDKPPRGWAELLKEGAAEVEIKGTKSKSTLKRTIVPNGRSVKMSQDGAWPVTTNLLSLDAAKFLDATGSEQAAMLAAAAGSMDWRALVPEAIKFAFPVKGFTSWQEWIDLAIASVNEGLSLTKSERDMYVRTVRGLEQLRGSVLADEGEIEAARAKLEARIIELKAEVEMLSREIAQAEAAPADTEETRSLAAAESELRLRSAGIIIDEATLAGREAAHNEEVKALAAKGPLLTYEQRSALRVKATALTRALASNEQVVTLLEAKKRALPQRYADLKSKKKCPTCGTAGKALANALARLEAAELDELNAQTASEQQKLVELKNAAETAETLADNAEKEAALHAQFSGVNAALMNERRVVELRTLIAAFDAKKTPKADIDQLVNHRYELKCEISDLVDELAQVAARVKEAAHVRSQLRTLAEAEGKVAECEKEVEQHNTLVKMLKDLRERLTAAAIKPVIDAMAVFTLDIFDEPLRFDGTDLGRFVDANWVPFRQFSGMEKAVAVAALTCALRSDAKAANIVVCDELSAIDDGHLALFLANVSEAISCGLITQFIGLSTPRAGGGKLLAGMTEIALAKGS